MSNSFKGFINFSSWTMPVPDIRVTLSIKWTLNGVFLFNLMSNIIRIHYFRKIFESFLAMPPYKIYYQCFMINMLSTSDIQSACWCPHNKPKFTFQVSILYPTGAGTVLCLLRIRGFCCARHEDLVARCSYFFDRSYQNSVIIFLLCANFVFQNFALKA